MCVAIDSIVLPSCICFIYCEREREREREGGRGEGGGGGVRLEFSGTGPQTHTAHVVPVSNRRALKIVILSSKAH